MDLVVPQASASSIGPCGPLVRTGRYDVASEKNASVRRLAFIRSTPRQYFLVDRPTMGLPLAMTLMECLAFQVIGYIVHTDGLRCRTTATLIQALATDHTPLSLQAASAHLRLRYLILLRLHRCGLVRCLVLSWSLTAGVYLICALLILMVLLLLILCIHGGLPGVLLRLNVSEQLRRILLVPVWYIRVHALSSQVLLSLRLSCRLG
jgi:hypothetical protein